MAKRTRKQAQASSSAVTTSTKAAPGGAASATGTAVSYVPTKQDIARCLDIVRAVPQLRLNYEAALRSKAVTVEVCTPLEDYILRIKHNRETIKAAVAALLMSDADSDLTTTAKAHLEDIIVTSKAVAAAANQNDDWARWGCMKIPLLCCVLTRLLEAMRPDFDSAGSLLDRIGPACDTLMDDPLDRSAISVLRGGLQTVKHRGMPRSRESFWATKYFHGKAARLSPSFSEEERPSSKRRSRKVNAWLHTPWLPHMALQRLTVAQAWPSGWGGSAPLPRIAQHLTKLLVKPSGATFTERAIKGWFKKEKWDKSRPGTVFASDGDDRVHHVKRALVLHVLEEKQILASGAPAQS